VPGLFTTIGNGLEEVLLRVSLEALQVRAVIIRACAPCARSPVLEHLMEFCVVLTHVLTHASSLSCGGKHSHDREQNWHKGRDARSGHGLPDDKESGKICKASESLMFTSSFALPMLIEQQSWAS